MIEKQALYDMDMLIRDEPTAARVLVHLVRLTEPSSGGVVIISRATLKKILGVSDPTIGRAIRVLVEGNWIQRMRVGGAYALAVNKSVAWTGPRGQMDHAVFSATVVASREEQDSEALESPPLRRVPASYQGEGLIASGVAIPPNQEIIEGAEPVITRKPTRSNEPSLDELERLGQGRLVD